jgi:hypothetical protein
MTNKVLFNFPEFDKWRDHYFGLGWRVFSPADHDRMLLQKPANWMPQESDSTGPWVAWAMDNAPGLRKMLGADLDWIAQNATAIHMLPGWEYSSGAAAEWALAKALKLEFFYST